MLALSSRPNDVVVGHVVHDLRPRKAALADRNAVRRLAATLGLRYAEAEIRVRTRPGNPEANARTERYAALSRLAAEHDCAFVAVAHQADDLAETVLMRLLRGAGAWGLSAMRPRRRLAGGIVLVRPMLGLTRTDAENLCRAAGVRWRTDATNRDTTRLRAAIRSRVMPVLRRVAPGFERRIARSADLLAQSARLVRRRARAVVHRSRAGNGELAWERGGLRTVPAIVLGEALREAVRLLAGKEGLDRLSSRVVLPVVEAIRSDSTAPKRFRLGPCTAQVTSREVRVSIVR